MNVLYLMPYNPVNPTFGGALRIYHLLTHLCKHHDVTVAGFSNPEQEKLLIEDFPELKGKTHFVRSKYSDTDNRLTLIKSLFTTHSHWYLNSRSDELQKILNRLTSEKNFDIIQSEFPALAMYNFNTPAKKVIDAHNVEYDNFRRMTKVKNPLKKLFYHLEAFKFYREETDVCSRQDALFATSERDISIFNKSVPNTPKYLIPNGVDPNYFKPFTAPPKPHSMVFVGMMKYVPNYDGMNYFLDEIFPKILDRYPDATITIIGKNPPESLAQRAGKNIIITGFVEDTRPYIRDASVYVVPLRMGGGTRLKILEALAMKKPIVTTSIGCEGIDVVNRESAMISDTPQGFADAVIELFSKEELCKKITETGYSLMNDNYRWESIGMQMSKAYEEITGKSSQKGYPNQDLQHHENNGQLIKETR